MMMLLCNNQEHIPTDCLHTSLAQVPPVSAPFLYSHFFGIPNFSVFLSFLFFPMFMYSYFFWEWVEDKYQQNPPRHSLLQAPGSQTYTLCNLEKYTKQASKAAAEGKLNNK